MHPPSPFRFQSFGSSDELAGLRQTNQVVYLRQYLHGLGVRRILIEDGYFDRDYLSEFSAFYNQSARGYSNLCKRLSFFTDPELDRASFAQALGGNSAWLDRCKQSFKGFTVLRPFEIAPLGRTVLACFPDQHHENRPRITKPSRNYSIHLAGIQLVVHGLAWQQQDSAVGACATIALWTLFHASAFDDHHAIPTTATITRSAHKTASLGARIFPSGGLNIHQLLEAIKEQNLSPGILKGDKTHEYEDTGYVCNVFSRERFCSGIAALIRSGYPVLLAGHYYVEKDGNRAPETPGHAVCAAGFRTGSTNSIANGKVAFEETYLEHVYIHDDNIGPYARFEVIPHPGEQISEEDESNGIALKHSRPDTAPDHPDIGPLSMQPVFVPEQAIIATHNEIRVSPDRLNQAAIMVGEQISLLIQKIREDAKEDWACLGVSVNARYSRLADYLGEILEKTLQDEPKRLSKVRLDLCEKVPPMSLHIGIIRLSILPLRPLIDILVDTSDNEHLACTRFWAHVAYHPFASVLAKKLHLSEVIEITHLIEAF